MPTIGHALVGAAVGFLLYVQTRGNSRRFNENHMIVLALNSLVGPDLGKFLIPFTGWLGPDAFPAQLNAFIHSLVGWTLFALPLGLVYYAIFRKSKTQPTTFRAIYLLMLAGGLLHFALDFLDGGVWLLPRNFGWSNLLWSLAGSLTGDLYPEGPLTDAMPWFHTSHLLLLGLAFMVLLIWMVKNRPLREVYIAGGVFVVLVVGIIALLGSQVVYGENDLGFALYGLLFWVLPLVLCYTAME
jgi:heme A synthase